MNSNPATKHDIALVQHDIALVRKDITWIKVGGSILGSAILGALTILLSR